ncbi:hypothetical protein CGLO_16581 [Colletotrichum gloeosporioides Cg-14]|uniref:Uncharacterized protein n=1 Tax=Colletotrichum gloeosporioides (strain Cg-14) TaxID=1237896 RepID=T0JYS2_COLGC|nr:hypothetical protein CGLO_16581 [Colletotrichum gloeosporioides Cg-14]
MHKSQDVGCMPLSWMTGTHASSRLTRSRRDRANESGGPV